jgi:rhamnosyltransferase
MFSAHQSCSGRERVPLIGPLLCYSAEQTDHERGRRAIPQYTFTRTAMSSGSLIRADIFAREGFYDESFFMDYVDYEFCLRLWKHGWKIIRANHAHLLHRLGLPQTHSLAGFKVTIKSHNAWRRYYIMRNRFVVFRRYALSSPAWCLYDFSWIFLELTKIILFEKDKLAQLRATCRGLWHGLSGNMQAKP